MNKVLISSLLFVLSTNAFAGYVKGYYRKNGTYVQPHYRSSPDKFIYNNYSYQPSKSHYNEYAKLLELDSLKRQQQLNSYKYQYLQDNANLYLLKTMEVQKIDNISLDQLNLIQTEYDKEQAKNFLLKLEQSYEENIGFRDWVLGLSDYQYEQALYSVQGNRLLAKVGYDFVIRKMNRQETK